MVLKQADKARIVVKWLAEQKGVPMSKIGEMVGYSNASAFSQVLNSKKKLPPSLPERIAALDPRINIDFLTGESQDMILGDEPQEDLGLAPCVHLRGQACRNLCHTISVSCRAKVVII